MWTYLPHKTHTPSKCSITSTPTHLYSSAKKCYLSINGARSFHGVCFKILLYKLYIAKAKLAIKVSQNVLHAANVRGLIESRVIPSLQMTLWLGGW